MIHRLTHRYWGPGIVGIAVPLLPSAVLVLATLMTPFIPSRAQAHQPLFCDHLSPYGGWTEVTAYGWVWLPPIVETESHPYTAGQWKYTEYDGTWSSHHPRVLNGPHLRVPRHRQVGASADRSRRRRVGLAASRSISRHIRSRSMQLPDNNNIMRRGRRSRGLPGSGWTKRAKPRHGWIRHDQRRRHMLHPQPEQRLGRRKSAQKETYVAPLELETNNGTVVRYSLGGKIATEASKREPPRIRRRGR